MAAELHPTAATVAASAPASAVGPSTASSAAAVEPASEPILTEAIPTQLQHCYIFWGTCAFWIECDSVYRGSRNRNPAWSRHARKASAYNFELNQTWPNVLHHVISFDIGGQWVSSKRMPSIGFMRAYIRTCQSQGGGKFANKILDRALRSGVGDSWTEPD